MRSTGSLPETETVANRSAGYMRRNDTWVSNTDTLPWSGTSAGGGYSTVQDEGVAQTQRNVLNFVGAGVTVTDVGSVTTITIPGSTVSGSAVGQTQIWNGSAWTAGALDLADGDARTGTLPAANGGTGIAGAGGTANRVLGTTDGSTWAAGLVALATMVSGLLPLGNLADGTANSVLGRAAGTGGVMAPIAASADGQVLRMAAGALAWGALDLADSDALTGLLPFASLSDGSAVSVFGRAGGTSGVMASIAASADGQVLRRAAGALSFGAVDLADGDAITGVLPFANIMSGSAASLFGRAAGTSGVMASIASSADGQVLRRAGGALAFGALDLADSTNAVTGLLSFANITSGSALSVFGRSANTSGVMASIAGTDGQVLRVSGTVLGFGTIATTGIGDGQVTLAKVANGTATSVIGRSAATGGVYADIAASVDGQVLRRAGGTLAWGAVDLADADGVAGLLAFANIADGASTSVLGRSAGTTGVMASIAASADGQVLQRVAGALTWATLGVGSIGGGTAVGQVLRNTAGDVPAWGALDLADADAVTGLLPFANISSLTGLSVFGRSANSSGAMAAITGADGQALRVAGTALGFGTLATAAYADSSVTLAKLASATAASLLGRSANSTGVYADIASSADGQVLRRSGGTLGFGALDLADADAVAGLLPFANIADGAITSVLGRAGGTAGVMAAVAATADGQFLQRVGGALTWATVGIGSIPGGSAVGQVLRNTAGNVPAWGAVDLADADAVTGLLALANLANGSASSVLGRSAASSGTMASIVGTAHQVLRADASAVIGFGAIDLSQSATVGASKLPLANLADMVGLSVQGRSANTTGVMAAITASATGQVLRYAGTTLAFGALDLADADAVTGLLPHANVASLAGLSVFGRSASSSGVMAAITGAANQVLQVNSGGTALAFGPLALAGMTGGSAVGQVLRNTAGNVPAWGALDLADADAVTGLLPGTNVSPNFGSQVVQSTGEFRAGAVGAAALRLQNNSEIYSFLSDGTTGVSLIFVNPSGVITYGDTDATGASFTIGSGGSYTWKHGATTTMSLSSTGLALPGASSFIALGADPADAGRIRLSNTDAINWESSTPGTDIAGLAVNSSNQLLLGSPATAAGAMVDTNVGVYTNGGLRLQISSSGDANFQDNNIFTTGFVALGANPADTGRIRLSNGDQIVWEANPAGSDIFGMTVDSSNQLILGNTGGSSVSYVQSPSSGGVHSFTIAGQTRLLLSATVLECGSAINRLRFNNAAVNPIIQVESSAAAAATGTSLEVAGQDMSGAGATVGGITHVRAGNSTNGTGGALNLYSGTGVTPGVFTMYRGSSVIYQTTSNGSINYNAAAGQLHTFQLNGSDTFTVSGGRLTVYGSDGVVEIGSFGGGSYPIEFAETTGTCGNVGLLTGVSGSNFFSGEGVLLIGKNDAVPVNTPSDGMFAWVADNAADGKYGLVLRTSDDAFRLGHSGVANIELAAGIVAVGTAGVGGSLHFNNLSAPPSAPSDGVKLYAFADFLLSKSQQGGTWQLAPASAVNRIFDVQAGSTSSTTPGQTIATLDFSVLPSDCSGIVKATILACDTTGSDGIGGTCVTASFRKANGTLQYYTSGVEGGAGNIGTGGAGFSGSNFFITITPSAATARTYSTICEVTYRGWP